MIPMRNIVVCIKYCMDTSLPLRLLEDENDVVQADEDIPIFIINPPDLCALEEALRIKQLFNCKIIVISLGSKEVIPALKYCLARGSDHAIHLFQNGQMEYNPCQTAAILADEIRDLYPWLVFCGNKSIDNGSGMVGPMLAEYLNIPQVTNTILISSIDHNEVIAHRKLEKGNRQIVCSSLPALISVSQFLNHPGYVAVFKQQYISDEMIERRVVEPKYFSYHWVDKITPPKPRPRKINSPDNALKASDRLKFMMTGGLNKKDSNTFEGTPEESAEKIFSYLQKNGF